SLEKSMMLFEQRIHSLKKLKQVTRYPIILFIVFFFLLLFIKFSLLPSYEDMFQSFANSTATIQFIIFLVNSSLSIFLLIVIVLFIFVLVWNHYKDTLSMEDRVHLYEKIPIWNKYISWQTSFY